MQIELSCEKCRSGVSIEGPPWPSSAPCECGATTPLAISDSLARGDAVDRCAVCGVDVFYLQKDFNRFLGISIVVVGILLYLLLRVPWGLVGLGGTWLVDLGLYFVVPWLTVCYKCRSLYRGFPRNPTHETFDLNVAEQFRV
ncbi:MAG: hypothetical protein HYR85_25690 [Planctomycetes bacterium]|nr:hypothetical protein [Planctomycetota bacterium]MBI3847726.1 hypothetical protein [Planctomycetota bacterium]